MYLIFRNIIAICGYNGTAVDFQQMRKVVDLVKFHQLEASLGFLRPFPDTTLSTIDISDFSHSNKHLRVRNMFETHRYTSAMN